MKFIPVNSSWIKFFAYCNLRIDYLALYLVIALLFIVIPQLTFACVVSCKSSLNISLDEFGQATITPSILLQDPSCNPNDFTVNIVTAQGASLGNVLTCAQVGMTVTATVTKISNGNSCSTIILVEDKIKPVINCADTTVLCIEPTSPQDLGFPAVSDNCSDLSSDDLIYFDEFIDLACFATQGNDMLTGKIKRTWTITDENGNQASCIQMIYLKRATIDDVDFPVHLDGFQAPALDCNDDPGNLQLTGKPTINGKPIVIGGHCEIVVSHSDQLIPLCSPSSYQILRTWTAIDYCSSEFTMHVQVIKVMDQTAPHIVCPGDITVGTSSNSCNATVILPVATATDDCSGFSINASWSFGSGYGPFTNVPVGEYLVTYTAVDQCGNSASCGMKVTVVDNVAPVAICDLSITVSLDNFGQGQVQASTFGSSSFDNCGVDKLRVSRDGVNFFPSVQFTCEDIDAGVIPVTFRVWDTSGNINECVVNAIIKESINPVIACPTDLTLTCDQDFTNLNLTGNPEFFDNCGVDTIYHNDIVDLNSCGVGSITRIWVVKDKKGNSASCVQMIYLEDNTPVEVIFPDDFTAYDCTFDPDPADSGEPQVLNDDCEGISITYQDQVFDISPSCATILRKWIVIDWCVYVPNSGSNNGYWTDTQQIEIFDNDDPEIFCPPDTVVGMLSQNCDGAFVQLTPATALDCNPSVTITNDSPYADNPNANASGFYPPGIHNVTFFAEDGCGNSASCTMQVVVEDAKAPTPICKEIAVSLEPDGTVTVTPQMINHGSYDNCTATNNLLFEVSPNVFTCDELGNQTIKLTVTDEAGNSSFCETIINIQDNVGACPVPSGKIAGWIITETGSPVQLTELELSGDMESNLTIGANGYYEFTDVPFGGNYTITPKKDVFPANGVSTFDMVFIRRHILNIQPLNSPYKMIAADINKSGTVTAFDLVLLNKLILQIDTEFTNNTSWRFIDATFVFPNPANPFFTPFPEYRSFVNLSQDELGAEFIGVKIGDVNGSANPSQINDEIENRSAGSPLQMKIPNQQLIAGEEYAVPVYASDLDEILGYQLTLGFDNEALEFIKVDLAGLESLDENNFGLKYTDRGLITTNWLNPQNADLPGETILFALKFRARQNAELRDLLEINSQIINAEAYNSDFEITDVELIVEEFLENESGDSETAILYQNFPNPFDENTKIGFDLPEGGQCLFEVYATDGGLVFSRKLNAATGYNEIRISKEDIRNRGVYFYRLSTPGGATPVRKFIME